MTPSKKRERRLALAVTYIMLAVLFVFAFFPTFWLLSTSFKPNAEAFATPPTWVPRTFTLENYVSQLRDRTGFATYFRNSIYVSTATAAVTILLSIPAGYAFARLRFRLKRLLLTVILASQMFPLVIIVIALYTLYRRIGLLDTLAGLVLSFTSFSLPFAIWMMRGFCEAVPKELEDAAMVDGTSRMGALWRIIVPLVQPGILAVGLFSFLNAWNNLIFALSLTNTPANRTIPPGFLLTYVGEFQYQWGGMAAGAMIVTAPTIILFIALQRFLVRGLMAGAVKG